MFCQNCGKEIDDKAVVCIHCGCATGNKAAGSSQKNWLVTLLLCFFTGGLGLHRFYTGYIGIGIIQLLTAGGCCIWALIDLIMIIFNNFKDANGNDLEK